ncbi:MAG: 3-dehydroquinate synthase [Bacteroidales bacterium]|nr:3-dehydroquinate synthase [Bacteroidales bacterium]
MIKASEKNKSLKTVKKIFDFFYENSVDRNTNVFVIGGGVTTDMGAFATSTWKRGCRLTLIPTTAMAMVDASIGGKTAINFKHTKNLIGTFYQPEAILIDINIFNNLPQEYLEQAFAEIIKHAICFDKQYFHALLNEAKTRYAPEGIRFYVDDIKKSIEIKLNIVLQDTEEKHMRKLLNFGHTVGHAIEMAYNLPHGKALYRGMMLELKTFIKMGYCNEDVLHKLFSIYNGYFILYNYPRISFKKIKHYILQDKKINNDFIILPIIKDIGTTELLKINKSEFLKTLKLVIDETYKS